MRVLILGGDGYLGWPTAMRLSQAGHQVLAVDNYLRRRICREEAVDPLFEVPELRMRAKIWRTAGRPSHSAFARLGRSRIIDSMSLASSHDIP